VTMSKPARSPRTDPPFHSLARQVSRKYAPARGVVRAHQLPDADVDDDDAVITRPPELPVNGFTPILTVMADYGAAPYLWLQTKPAAGVGVNVAEGTEPFESCCMNEDLAWRFAAWAQEFSNTNFYSVSSDQSDWDRLDFNARGLALAGRLKQQVGNYYRVVYERPAEDPNCKICERTEVLADGSVKVLPADRSQALGPVKTRPHFISGIGSGVERAILDFSKEAWHWTHGGCIPEGRVAEDGVLHVRYQMTELADANPLDCRKFNVEDSDATLVLNTGALADRLSAVVTYAQSAGKPCLVVQVEEGQTALSSFIPWLEKGGVNCLFVTGPEESSRPEIYAQALRLLRDFCEASGQDLWRVMDAPADTSHGSR
jgi:hypothetical protein